MLDTNTEDRLLRALKQDEDALIQTHTALRLAMTDYNLASSRYAAVRDLVTERLHESPYSASNSAAAQHGIELNGQAYRFLGMNPADAAVQVLLETDQHLSLFDLVLTLGAGGLSVVARTINAALLNKDYVKKDEAGNYYYEPPNFDADGNLIDSEGNVIE